MAARRDRKASEDAVGPVPLARQSKPPKEPKPQRAKKPPATSLRPRRGQRFEGTVTSSTPQHSKQAQFLHSMAEKLRSAGRRGG